MYASTIATKFCFGIISHNHRRPLLPSVDVDVIAPFFQAQLSPISAIVSAETANLCSQAGANLPSLPLLGGGGGSSSFVFSAIILWKPIPTPSMTASRMAHPIAPFRIARGPPLTASAPPVKNPAMIAFHGSSFLRTPFTAQSNVLNMPPQTPKFPPRTGARALIAVIAVEQVSQSATVHCYCH